ncbi:MAG: carboxylating nicotinate-nucleotide diphosphorylase [Dissulfurispiraceae bacterium]|jgi:nicotinate-nucleotide pyrophosphorylase (carboxylating)
MWTSSKEFIRTALAEDIGHGDVTSSLIIGDETARADIIAKEAFILAGMPFVAEVFELVDSGISVEILCDEGGRVKRGDIIAHIWGRAKSLLAGERVALNILQHLSGIAAAAGAFVEKVKGLPVKIVDTRKTKPGMRIMEKYAVTMGGATNHRFGLYDGILIKDNHIEIAGGIKKAIGHARKAHHLLKIEVEVKDMDELMDALEAGADVIMLDNMSVEEMKKAVKTIRLRDRKIVIEASGNVNLKNVRAIAETGVDIVSVGAITHSARAVDISMKINDMHQ